MTSSKKGLYVADLGSDDGSRLTVDGALIYNNWTDQSFSTRYRVLMNLNGNSSLNYEFYENAANNRVIFQNLTLVIANVLSIHTTQSICKGSSGTTISGDSFGLLPSGISLSGTGYQWTYSLTPGGARINISGATAETYTPNTSIAPFNVPGTYYIYRNAKLSSSNNTGINPYVATNESNPATITVNPLISATIFYAGSPYCNSLSTAQPVTLTGTSGGTFSSTPSGLKINSLTGAIIPGQSNVNNYTVTYAAASSGGCPAFTTSANIIVGKAGTWSGVVDNTWNNAGNWFCGVIPGPSTNVTITKSDTNYPPIIIGVASANNLIIQDGASVVINGTAKIYGNITNNNGNLSAINGTLEMAGAANQTIAGSLF
ncbi:MAG: hypothetical protein ACRDE5_14660, partial [Ginsengibacter sp.]